MDHHWVGLVDFCVLGGCLLAATFLRSRIAWLGRFMIPNSIVAGFLCWFLGDEILGLIKIDPDRSGNYVYHLLAITFIAMALRNVQGRARARALSTGFILTIGIGLQTFLGLAIAFGYKLLWDPDLFVAFGYYLMLGFSQGPGQAYALGKTWEPLGFAGAGNIGLSFAAIGYIWACTIGVVLVNRGLKKQNREGGRTLDLSADDKRGLIDRSSDRPEAGRLTTASLAIDSFSFHLAVVGGVYLAAYGLLTAVERLLLSASPGEMTRQLVNTLWGIHFIFASLLAMLLQKVFFKAGKSLYLDNGLLTRISGGALDFMVTAAIGAISIAAISNRIGLILLTTTLGGISMVYYVGYMVGKSRMSHLLEREVSIFGTMTGTLTTGLTLNRIVDPQFRSPAPEALLFGGGITLPMSIPYILSSLLVIHGHTQANPDAHYAIVIGLTALYTLLLFALWRWFVVPRTDDQG